MFSNFEWSVVNSENTVSVVCRGLRPVAQSVYVGRPSEATTGCQAWYNWRTCVQWNWYKDCGIHPNITHNKW